MRVFILIALCFGILSACSKQMHTAQVAPDLDPVVIPAFESTKPIAFRKIVLKVPRHESVGTISKGVLCIRREEFTLSGGRHQLDTESFNDIFRTELLASNYNVVGDPDALFEDSGIASAEYFIAGLIVDIEANICYPASGFGNYNKSSAAVYLKVQWQIYNTLRRKIVAKIETEGSASIKAQLSGFDIAFETAFALATRNLLADSSFYQLVRVTGSNVGSRVHAGSSSDTVSSDDAVFSLIEDLVATLERVVPTSERRIDAERLSMAVAVVRSAIGHGSGFVISSGLLLTNQHVVQGAAKVRLIFGDGAEISAEVLAVNETRDVALLRFEDSQHNREPLPVRTTKVQLGEEVFSIGSPFSEEYIGTLKRGIVSAHRNLRGLNYIQSDVAVNPGSSGGPLIDEYGRVIGISVSGVMSQSVNQHGINFFIPIIEALAALGD